MVSAWTGTSYFATAGWAVLACVLAACPSSVDSGENGGGGANESTSSDGASSTGGAGGVNAQTVSGSGGTSSTGGVAFGCSCAMDTDCATGLTCYPYGMGNRCSAACVDGVCPVDESLGCNGMVPGECKPPLSPACP